MCYAHPVYLSDRPFLQFVSKHILGMWGICAYYPDGGYIKALFNITNITNFLKTGLISF